MKHAFSITQKNTCSHQLIRCLSSVRRWYPLADILILVDNPLPNWCATFVEQANVNIESTVSMQPTSMIWQRMFCFAKDTGANMLYHVDSCVVLLSALPESTEAVCLYKVILPGSSQIAGTIEGFSLYLIQKIVASAECLNPCYLFPDFVERHEDSKFLLDTLRLTLRCILTRVNEISEYTTSPLIAANDGALGFDSLSLPPIVRCALKGLCEENLLFALRIKIHKIEKGLIFYRQSNTSRPFGFLTVKSLFEELKTLRLRFEATNDIEEIEQWGCSVLEEFFLTFPNLELEAELADLIRDRNVPTQRLYVASSRRRPEVTIDELTTLVQYRKSIRFFTHLPPGRIVLSRCLNLAANAPSSCNRSSYRVAVVDEPTLATKIIRIPEGARRITAPCVTVWIACHDAYDHLRDLKTPIIDATLACMQFQLAAAASQLDTLMINFPDEERYRGLLKTHLPLHETESIVTLVAVGTAHPDAWIAISSKCTAAAFVRYYPQKGRDDQSQRSSQPH